MNSFEGFNIDDINACGTNDFGSGLQARLYFAPAEFFQAINLPPRTDFQNTLLISVDDLIFNADKMWSAIDILVDENEVKTMFPGSVRRKRAKSSIEFFILGFRAKVLGFLELMKNENLIFCIITSDGHGLLIGNLLNYANFDKADATTAKKYEDNAGASAAVMSNSPVYIFKENLIIETGGSTEPGGGGSFSHFSFIDLTDDY